MSQVSVREATGGSDVAFIYATWRKALWYYPDRVSKPWNDFYRDTTQMIKNKLTSADVRIACLSDDPDMLLGWAVLNDHKLEFVYVKIDYRRSGIAKLLTKGFKTHSPPETRMGKKLARKLEQEKSDGRKEETGQTAQEHR